MFAISIDSEMISTVFILAIYTFNYIVYMCGYMYRYIYVCVCISIEKFLIKLRH